MNQIKKLEELIKKNKILYYQGRPEISDAEFDALEDELKKIDPNNSVLTMVGSNGQNLDKVKHEKKMLSLNKTYDIKELKEWQENSEVISTFKIDGVSCSLIYEDGNLLLAKTRGDGAIGENITPKVLWMESVPKKIKAQGKIEIRGEMYCSETDFYNLAEEMEKCGLERPSSQRNIVAGLVSRKENLELSRYIRFMGFDYLEEKPTVKTEEEKFLKLKENHFIIPSYHLHKTSETLQEAVEEVKAFMDEGDFQVDGLVLSMNDLKKHEELGETSHHPRYKMAFKFKGESKKTTIREISWQVSRNGILTPVANIEPIELSGAKISNVTLHNYGIVKTYHLKKGDMIDIIRSGEVIPKFLSVVESVEGECEFPQNCPECLAKVEVKDIRIVCSNPECFGRIKGSVLNFIEKIGIEELSFKRLEELLKKNLVKKVSDLYRLSVSDFLTLDKTKETLANKLYESIQKSKNTDLVTFLSSLGISGGAYNKCEKVVQSGIHTIDQIKKLTIEDLIKIDSFAEKSAQDFLTSLQEKFELIDELLALGFVIAEKEITKTVFTGKKICITGELTRKRSEIENEIREIGGIVVSSVSKNTDYLLTNEVDSASSKFKKAKELSITIISEEDFFKKI